MSKASKQPETLSCTFEQAEENHLLDGRSITTARKIEWFEYVTWLAWQAEQQNESNVSEPSEDD